MGKLLSQEEVDALESYAANGGLLVLTNSLHRLKYGTQGLDPVVELVRHVPLAQQIVLAAGAAGHDVWRGHHRRIPDGNGRHV